VDFAAFAIDTAIKYARRSNIDEDTAASIAGEIATKLIQKTIDDDQRCRVFITVVRKRLLTEVIDELKIFGPTTNALRQRARRNAKKSPLKQESVEVLAHVPHKEYFNHVDFLEQFERDPELLKYVVLVAAGYTQTELITKYGYTRKQITQLKERFEDVRQN
jgi:hypothetical protein